LANVPLISIKLAITLLLEKFSVLMRSLAHSNSC
jgi:hypothetical protein